MSPKQQPSTAEAAPVKKDKRIGRTARWAMKSNAALVSDPSQHYPANHNKPSPTVPVWHQKDPCLGPDLRPFVMQPGLPFWGLPPLGALPPGAFLSPAIPPFPLVFPPQQAGPPTKRARAAPPPIKRNRPVNPVSTVRAPSQSPSTQPTSNEPESHPPQPVTHPEVSADSPPTPLQEQPFSDFEAVREGPANLDAAEVIANAADVTPEAAAVVPDAGDVVADGADVIAKAADVIPKPDDVIPDAAGAIPEAADITATAADVIMEPADVTANATDVTPEADDVTPEASDVIADADVVVPGPADGIKEAAEVVEAAPLLSAPPAVDAMVTEAASLLSSAAGTAGTVEAASLLSAAEPDPLRDKIRLCPSSFVHPGTVANGECGAEIRSPSPAPLSSHEKPQALSFRTVECQTEPERICIEGTNLCTIYPLEGWVVQRVELVRDAIGYNLYRASDTLSAGHC